MATLYYNRQAVGTYKCCTTVYGAPASARFNFDVNFLNPALLPPITPMFRDLNVIGFSQELRPGQVAVASQFLRVSSSARFVVSATMPRALFCDPRIHSRNGDVDSRDAPWIGGCYSQGMRGFSLLEVLVATTIVAVGVERARAAGRDRDSRESATPGSPRWPPCWRRRRWRSCWPKTAGTLTPSPADALGHNVDGFADFVDAAGHTIGAGPVTPPGSAYLRRWSIDPLPDSRSGAWILQVLVTDLRSRSIARFTAAKMAKAS